MGLVFETFEQVKDYIGLKVAQYVGNGIQRRAEGNFFNLVPQGKKGLFNGHHLFQDTGYGLLFSIGDNDLAGRIVIQYGYF
jgi:hypothetical protein